ncbi:MAG TPA: sigma-54 dependent transcriptional regulator [Kofleriaceae bacterium]|jgi:two-component system nitrogen regulation response regulator GlnG
MAHVLLIDDDPVLIPEQVRHAFSAPGYRVSIAPDGASGVAMVRREPPDVILLDIRLPDRSGLDVYAEIRAIDARIPVIFVTMAKTADTAIEAMKRGAFNYLYKPLDLDVLHTTVREALDVDRRMRSRVSLGDAGEDLEDGNICGASPAMLDVYKAIGRVAPQDVTVLISGESGTGKELVARAIYQHSTRANAPFLALNCAAIPETLLESELFGHEKSAFTGADRRRIGKFEQCNGGTILLDEIGDMSLLLQAKLLRLLQEQTFERVGGNETIRTDVRVIASTHRDLKAEERFRSDLYYRLGVFTIHVPPLRERGDDLELLVRRLVRRYSRELGRNVSEVSPAAIERLRAHTWPGNVRELQSVLKQALLNAQGSVLLPAQLPDFGTAPVAVPVVERSAPSTGPLTIDSYVRAMLLEKAGDVYEQTHREVDRRLLTLALEQTNGNQRDAARLLGISRQTMRVRMRSLGLSISRSVELDDDA